MVAQPITCPQCGTPNQADARFCAKCRHALNAAGVTQPGVGGRDIHNTDKLPLGEFIGDYIIVGYLNERSRGTTSLIVRRTYFAESADGKSFALLHEAPDEKRLRAIAHLAQAMAQQPPLLHLPRLLMPASLPWYGVPRAYAVEPLPANELGPAQLQGQTSDKWQTWTQHLAIGLALLNEHGLALGLREAVPYDDVLRHVAILSNGIAQWKDLSDLTLLSETPEAQFADVRALAAAMLRSKLSGSPGRVAQLLGEAAQPGARITAEQFALGFGEKKFSTIPVREEGLTAPLRMEGPLQIEHASATHKGMMREGNEDTPLHIEFKLNNDSRARHALLLAVADGMGGEEAGEMASLLTVRELANAANAFVMSPADLDANAWVQSTVEQINDVVIKEAQRRGNQMGATLVFALVCNGIGYLGNVGDSRIYRWNLKRDNGRMVRLTKDHSLVQRLVDMNQIDDVSRYSHPDRNMVLRSIGDPKTAQSDQNPPETIQSGDWLLLCSDGLWEMVRDEQIAATLREAKSPQDACDKLIEAANRNGGEDNIGVVIARFY